MELVVDNTAPKEQAKVVEVGQFYTMATSAHEEKFGFLKGQTVLVVGEGIFPCSPEDPYLRRVYFAVVKFENGTMDMAQKPIVIAAESLDLLRRMRELHTHRRLGTLERLRGALLELIGFTTERFAGQLQSLAEQRVYLQTHTDALRRVLKFIDENLHSDISLNEVAEAAFLSPNYLSQLLKKQTGLAFVDWLTGRRMDRARELLAHTAERVYSIANTVGYDDEAYFTRRFRQRFGVSPTEYRRSMQAGS